MRPRHGLGIDRDRVAANLDRYGNTTAASIPIVLDEATGRGPAAARSPRPADGLWCRFDVGCRCVEVLMSKTQRLPKRDQVPAEDTWDLTSLFDG